MNLHQQYLTENRCFKQATPMTIKGVCVHSTGANNPYLKRYVDKDDGLLGYNANQNGWNHSSSNVMLHGCIGLLGDGKTVATYNLMPYTYKSWHCGSGKKGSFNNSHISFEICEDGLDDADYFNKVYNEAVEYVAYLCEMFSLNPLEPGVVVCHSEAHSIYQMASNHSDVLHWFPKFGKDMDDFRNDVNNKMNENKGEDSDMISQEQFNQMMDVYLQQKRESGDPAWAKEYLAWAKEKGLLTGVNEQGELAGSSWLTRAEMSVIMKAYYEKVDKT